MHHKIVCVRRLEGEGRGGCIEYYGKFSRIFKHLHCRRRRGHDGVAKGAETTPVIIT